MTRLSILLSLFVLAGIVANAQQCKEAHELRQEAEDEGVIRPSNIHGAY